MYTVDISPAGNFVPFGEVRDIRYMFFKTREEAIKYVMNRLKDIDPSIEIDIDWGKEITLSANCSDGKGRFSTLGFYVEELL